MPMSAARDAFLAALRHVVTALHEELPVDTRDDWATRVHALLDEGPDTSSLRAVHVWHSATILPLLNEAAQDGDSGVFTALGELHAEAAGGRRADQDTWRSALTPVLLRLYDAAYDRTSAYAEAHAGARDYALGKGFSAPEADGYGHEYARLSTDASAQSCAEAHAEALGHALARAYATDGCEAYADTCPGAQLRAVVRATTERADPLPAARLAEGLLSALAPPWP
ncbi:hypothetical protein [Streptomyces xylophagus]|uniref:hypothetical protein n=1 Tax=Streptomyces xylophagus TaxID=285514 RepID=UPI0005BA90A7|nr:hypothetical protein [Streptomyces xylophagus]